MTFSGMGRSALLGRLSEGASGTSSYKIVPSRVPLDLGIPRPIPLDVAMMRLGYRTYHARPDGGAERNLDLGEEFWHQRHLSDFAIVRRASLLGPEDLPGFYPEGHPEFRFGELPERLLVAARQFHERRRLAGIEPFGGGGLPLGYWDDVYSRYSVAPMSWKAAGIAHHVMLMRDMVLVGAGHLARPESFGVRHAAFGEALSSEGWFDEFLGWVREAGADPDWIGPVDLSLGVEDEIRIMRDLDPDEVCSLDWADRFGTICP